MDIRVTLLSAYAPCIYAFCAFMTVHVCAAASKQANERTNERQITHKKNRKLTRDRHQVRLASFALGALQAVMYGYFVMADRKVGTTTTTTFLPLAVLLLLFVCGRRCAVCGGPVCPCLAVACCCIVCSVNS